MSVPSSVAQRDDHVRSWETVTGGLSQFIGGEFVDGTSADSVPVVDPSSGDVIASLKGAGPGDVSAAIDAAERAQPAWNNLGFYERAMRMLRLADAIEERRSELAGLDAVDSGNPVIAMEDDVLLGLRQLRQMAGMGLAIRGETFPMEGGGLHYTSVEPFGVVARIVPFNHPSLFAITKIAAPLIGGNTVVMKPAEQTSLTNLFLGELFAEYLPEGVVNVVTGGAQTGATLIADERVKRIAFMGSVETGMRIQSAAAQVGIKYVTLELGGKNPMIVFPDADVSAASVGCVTGMNLTTCQGQSCGSNSRIFVHDDIYDEFMDGLVAELKGIRLGVAYSRDTDMGPVIDRRQLDRIADFVSHGRDSARIVYEAPVSGDLPQGGYFSAPTVIDQIAPNDRLAVDEIFGPVISVFRWKDVEGVVAAANDVRYGLTASVWSKDIDRATSMASRLQAGYVWINEHGRHYIGTPFGGYKASGIGEEESFSEIESFLQRKSVHIRVKP
ncbi:MAG: aldehyde dehydrogenase family protein [Actinobacteria bacterium]|nr:aldehyde dehydrogenase family protein [Actinomycetota bacterium]